MKLKLLSLVAAFAFIFSTSPRAGWSANDASNGTRYVEVSGEGEVMIEPDQAILSFGVETRGAKLNDVKDENAKRTKSLLDSLKKLGIKPEDIRTEFIQLNPQYNYNAGRPTLIGYIARKDFTVTLKDIPSYGKVLQAVLDAGVEYAGGLRFDTSKRKELEDEARKRAVTDARKKAELLASSAGGKIGAPLLIQENAVGPRAPVAFRGAMAMKEAAPDDQLAAGQISITANVTVRFELQEAH